MQKENSVKGTCKDIEENLVLYHYGECAGKDRNKVEAHLVVCVSCRRFLDKLRTIPPLTVKPDEPPKAFWDSYSREMRQKLAAVEERASWRSGVFSHFRPWSVPTVAAALVLLLVVALTFTRGIWQPQQPLSKEEPLVQMQPVAENLEFFETVDLLDSIDLLETLDARTSGHSSA